MKYAKRILLIRKRTTSVLQLRSANFGALYFIEVRVGRYPVTTTIYRTLDSDNFDMGYHFAIVRTELERFPYRDRGFRGNNWSGVRLFYSRAWYSADVPRRMNRRQIGQKGIDIPKYSSFKQLASLQKFKKKFITTERTLKFTILLHRITESTIIHFSVRKRSAFNEDSIVRRLSIPNVSLFAPRCSLYIFANGDF